MNRFSDPVTDLALISARIVDFCARSSGFADFENTVDRGSAVDFGVDSENSACLEIWIIDLSLAWVSM